MTANGVPLLMSDLSTSQGVAHIVADLIPTTDLGNDFSPNQGPLLDFIKEGTLKQLQNNFRGISQSPAQSIGLSLSNALQTTEFEGRALPPAISGLYQTPVQDSFDFSQAGQFSDQQALNGQITDSSQFNQDGSLISQGVSPIQDTDSFDFNQAGLSVSQESSQVQGTTSFDFNKAGPAITQDTFTVQGTDLSSFNQDGPSGTQETSPLPGINSYGFSQAGPAFSQETSTIQGTGPFEFNQPASSFSQEGFSVPGIDSFEVNPVGPSISQEAFPVEITESKNPVIGVPLPIGGGNSGIALQNTFDSDGNLISVIDSNDASSSQNISPLILSDEPISQVSIDSSIASNIFAIENEGSFVSQEVPSNDGLQIFSIEQGDISSSFGSGIAPSVSPPAVGGLYSAPPTSQQERTDLFSSQSGLIIPLNENRKKSISSQEEFNVEDFAHTWEQLAKNLSLMMSTGETEVRESNDRQLNSLNSIGTQSHSGTSTHAQALKTNTELDSFFIVTKGDLDLQEIISQLDDDVKEGIRIFDSPSLIINSSLSDENLKTTLTQMLTSHLVERPIPSEINSDPQNLHQQQQSFRKDTNRTPTMVKLVGRQPLTSILSLNELSSVVDELSDAIDEMNAGNITSKILPTPMPIGVSSTSPLVVDSETNEQLLELLDHQKNLNNEEIQRHERMMQEQRRQLRTQVKTMMALPNTLIMEEKVSPVIQHERQVVKIDASDVQVTNGVSNRSDNSNSNLQTTTTQSPSSPLLTALSSNSEDIKKGSKEKSLNPINSLLIRNKLESPNLPTKEGFTIVDASDSDYPDEEDDIIEIITQQPATTLKQVGHLPIQSDSSEQRTGAAGKFQLTQTTLRTSRGRPLPARTSNSSNPGRSLAEVNAGLRAAQEDAIQSTTEEVIETTDIPPVTEGSARRTEQSALSNILGVPQDLKTTSQEYEINVIDFLRSENLTAFADLLVETGLNRDMIRGGNALKLIVFIV